MLATRRSMMLVFVVLIALSPGLGWSRIPALPTAVALAAPTRVAYVYNTDTTSRDSFKTMLELRGFAVDLVPLASVGGANPFNFSADQAILIGDDTGTDAGGWLGDPTALSQIATAGKNIIGIGYGGSHFFNALQLS